jgi:hypothetical protein
METATPTWTLTLSDKNHREFMKMMKAASEGRYMSSYFVLWLNYFEKHFQKK